MKSIYRQLRRNPFWPLAQEVLENSPFKTYAVDRNSGGESYRIIVHVLNHLGNETTRHYNFPQRARGFTAAMNFKSQFRHWLENLPNDGFYPLVGLARVPQRLSTEPQIPNRPQMKVDIHPEFRQTPPPSTELVHHEVFTPVPTPTQPTPEKVDMIENPPATTLVQATFLVSPENLSLLIEVAKGTATFIDAVGVSGEVKDMRQDVDHIIKDVQDSKPSVPAVPKRKRENINDQMFNLMVESDDPLQVWSVATIAKKIKGYAPSTITTAFTTLKDQGVVNKVGSGLYQLRQN